MALKWTVLAVAFGLELAMLALAGAVGSRFGWVGVVVAVVVAAALWGGFAAPKSLVALPEATRRWAGIAIVASVCVLGFRQYPVRSAALLLAHVGVVFLVAARGY
ncbi:MAG: DUF2568 domain-containing protein [Myxococcales bacterium]